MSISMFAGPTLVLSPFGKVSNLDMFELSIPDPLT